MTLWFTERRSFLKWTATPSPRVPAFKTAPKTVKQVQLEPCSLINPCAITIRLWRAFPTKSRHERATAGLILTLFEFPFSGPGVLSHRPRVEKDSP